ncbi:MAG: CPBP family intramembrane metalloprotease [Parcubacteria group bacterium]|nr:CPBP family intramembrane metalloprotease [Parcubacteria group bacterium]
MRFLINWLSKEAKGIEVIKLMACCLILDVVLTIVAMVSVLLYDVDFFSIRDVFSISPYLPFTLMFWAFIEEVLFRFVPLALAVVIFGKSRKVIAIALMSSIIFGFLHGGLVYIFIQGVDGFLWCLLFLKCGGFQWKNFKPLLICTTVHASLNGTIVLASLLF